MANSTMSLSWANNRAWLGSQVTIRIYQSDSSIRHRVEAEIRKNGAVQTNIWITTNSPLPSQGVANRATWVPPANLSQYAVNGKVSITFKLYMNMAAPGYGNPVSQISVDVIDTSSFDPPTLSDFTLTDTSGNYSKFGAYVARKSGLKAVISASAVSGASISQYKLAVGGASSTSSSSTVTMAASQLTSTGSIGVTASVTDTYGHTAQKTKQITVLPYGNPSLYGSAAYRYDVEASKEDDESNNVRVRIAGSVSSLNELNAAQIALEYKLHSESEWTTHGTYDQGVSWDFTADIPGLDSSYQYDIRITVTDELGTKASSEYEILPATPVMDFLNDGEGLAIGKVAVNQGFEVAWPSKFESSATFDGSVIANGSAEFNGNTIVNRLYYKIGARSREPIYMIEGEANGDGIKMGAGGVVVIGSGESMNAVADGYGYSDNGGGSEYTHICSDNSVYIQTGCQNGFSSRKEFIFGSNGTFTIPSHIYMQNNSALCGDTTSGSVVPLLRMNTSNQVELTWTSGGLKGRVWKQIWSGTWSSGSLTLADLPYYNVLVMETNLTTGSMLVGFRDPNGYFVFSGIDENSEHYVIMACSTIASGTKLTMNMRPWKMWFNVEWTGVNSSAGSVTRIYGVL